jgi:mitofusin
MLRISNLLANENTRKWIAPVAGAVTIGLTAYFILELPSSVPRTIGRRIKAKLVADENGEELWVDVHAARVGRETRKVLRLASWDQKGRLRSAMEESSKIVQGAEEMEKRAKKALEWFEQVGKTAGDIVQSVQI